MKHHYLDSSIVILFATEFDREDSIEKYWDDKNQYYFMAPKFAVDQEVLGVINGARRNLLQLAEALDSEFNLNNLDKLDVVLKKFAKKELNDPNTIIYDFIEENYSFFRKFVLNAKDKQDLLKKINREFSGPQNFAYDILSDDHKDVNLVTVQDKKEEYKNIRKNVQEVIQHEKRMDDLIYTGSIIISDEKALEKCYFSTMDQDEFCEENRESLKQIDNRIEIFIPKEEY